MTGNHLRHRKRADHILADEARPGTDQIDLFHGAPSAGPADPSTRPEAAKRRLYAPPKCEGSALTPITRRIIDSSVSIELEDLDCLTYQHTVLCQTALPYHNLPGERLWERRNGLVSLRIEAGARADPRTGAYIETPLPFGTRARLVMMHLNATALQTQKAVIEIEPSLTAFTKRIVQRAPRGHDIRTIKAQLGALATATVRLAVTDGQRTVQVNDRIIKSFDLWAPRSPEQTVLWSSIVRLSEDYFQSLIEHAVPLDERAVAALSHSALALDLYSWLSQRLHRVPQGRVQTVAWISLYEQFGARYSRMRDFRSFFKQQLAAVHTQYPSARIDTDHKALYLRQSPPPVPRRLIPTR